jgi:hypothetical protein
VKTVIPVPVEVFDRSKTPLRDEFLLSSSVRNSLINGIVQDATTHATAIVVNAKNVLRLDIRGFIEAGPESLYHNLRTIIKDQKAVAYGYAYQVTTDEGPSLVVVGHVKGKPFSGYLISHLVEKKLFGYEFSPDDADFEIPNLFEDEPEKPEKPKLIIPGG